MVVDILNGGIENVNILNSGFSVATAAATGNEVYSYARKFVKVGIAEALVKALEDGISSQSFVSATIALKAVAANDEICRSVAENAGIDSLLICIDDSDVEGNNVWLKLVALCYQRLV